MQDVLTSIRQSQPLIHHITNQVVINFTANGLLSFGGAPVMAIATEEVADMASAADGLLINIGTLTAEEHEAMILAGKAANEKGIPVVLDPVGVAATPYRTKVVHDILKQVKIAAIKGNAGEMAHLVDMPWETKGVDSLGDGNVDDVAVRVAKTYKTTAVVTGKIDTVSTGKRILHNDNGHPFLERVTGAGCLLGSILMACLTTDNAIEDQVLTALTFYGLAAEYAASQPSVSGSGTFKAHFIDALSFDIEQLQRR